MSEHSELDERLRLPYSIGTGIPRGGDAEIEGYLHSLRIQGFCVVERVIPEAVARRQHIADLSKAVKSKCVGDIRRRLHAAEEAGVPVVYLEVARAVVRQIFHAELA